MAVCDGERLTDLSYACVRSYWAAVIPLALVGVVLLSSVPPLSNLLRIIHKPLSNFLPVHEAEALSSDEKDVVEDEGPTVPLWRTLLLSATSLVETLLWVGVGCYSLIVNPEDIWSGVRDLLVAATWFYAALRPIVRPTATAPWDLFSLFVAHFILDIVTFAGHLYDQYVFGLPMPSTIRSTVYIINIVAVGGLLVLVMNMPLGVPSKRVKKEDIGKTVSPEDYTTVWGWMSFRWVVPLLENGTYNTLNEDDVWNLSPTMQARPLYTKFSRFLQSNLFKRLFKANAIDLILDFTLTYVSIVFNYAGPFFLKRILDALSDEKGGPDKRAIAYVYAFLAFLSSLCKAQADVQHLWYGRRACTRIRTELMAAIYDKALKRKDFSGIVDKDAAEKKAKPPGAKADPKADDPKAGADIGKIVNLMAGDANRCAMTVSAMYFIYGAPFEIVIASLFLYQLLGLSAFAGFIVLILSWPLNNFVARRAVRIQKGVSVARDKRMGVLNELISAVKFIKFFAWEDRWVQRVLDAREVEMQWMIKARVNSVCFSLIWTTAPILVSIVSFFVYIWMGNKLDIGTAFTAIALYQMIRAPLNAIPAWIVQVLQSKVALDRISTFLDEDEVDEQVSTIKKGRVPPSAEAETGLGIAHGSFKWNEVEEKKDDKAKGKDAGKANGSNGHGAAATTSDEVATAVDDASVVSATPSASDHRFELRDIDVRFPEGKLTVVTGPTASGKTALLMALLGEMTTLEGRIVMSKNASLVDEFGFSHTISYAAQTPWLRHQSIKDNILFGYPYDDGRYKAVIECCALQPDLEILEDGDATEIGARGVSLSGGQKARVALARAVYARSKYVLLDDPLSAVDSHTARMLFEKLLRGPLLANRTVVLVTHHVELVLPGAHYLVRMLDGRIDTQGTIQDLRASGVLDDIAQVEEIEAHKDEQAIEAKKEEENPNAEIDAEATEAVSAPAKDKKKPRKLIEEEHRETGSVKWNIYKTYLKASSYWTWGILSFLIILTQVLGVGEKLWIRAWGVAYSESALVTVAHAYSYNAYAEHQHVLGDGLSHFHHTTTMAHTPNVSFSASTFTLPSAEENPFFYIGIYALISLSTAFVNIGGVITQYTGALRASRILFDRLLKTVVRATMRWHDVTPQGRMLNRFSKDVETVDSSLASTLQQVNQSLALFAVSMLTVIYVFPLFIFPAIILGFFYRRAAIAYLNTGRDIRRMESNTRSPIFANFSELLEGIVTVRAFSAEERFLDDLYKKVDLTTRMWYTFWMTNRWLLLTFDALGATGILATTLFALSGYVDAGMAGICITSAMSFTTSDYWACRFWTALELDLNSVERVVEYLDLPQEPPAIVESSRPPAYWPSSTSTNKDSMLTVEDLVIKYAPDLPAVLHGVSFSLKAKERIGLLGRTGSGKSTLAMSILRFVDPTSGKITIDGIDISKIGLHDLRSRITFIPQDATLFSGTLRENLDPFNDHTDAECLDVLARVQMLTDSQATSQHTSRAASRAASIHEGVEREATIASVSTTATETEGKTVITLDTQVSPGGANFSQGQRQLIAMARALLRRSAIIVLDEATSSIDFATDAKIQATIREEFGQSMLLTVAHRLRTVIDYDRLIVLDRGELAEFDTPLNLIQREGGIFRSMCLKSGTFAELEAAAKAKAERDLQQAS